MADFLLAAVPAPPAAPPQDPTVLIVALLVVLATAVGVAVLARRRRSWLTLAVATATAAGATVALAQQTPGWTIAVGAVVLAVAAAGWWARRGGTASTVSRWGATSRRKAGVASTLDIARVASAPAMRRKATTVRPSMEKLTRRDRARSRTTEVAIPLIRVALTRVWASIEDVVLIFGGPRTGKTGWLAGRVIDAPGALLVTSTRTDLHDLTATLRSQRGPVRVFNAAGLGGLASTVSFDPLTGCSDPVTAAERATDLLTATSFGGGGDREYWDAQARRVLAALLHAAALDPQHQLGMRDVLGWVSDPDSAEQRVTNLLRKSIEPAYVEDATQFVTTNDRTRSSITSTIMPALGWLTSPTATAAAAPGRSLDVAELLRTRGTVYLLGAEESQTAPLVCALTGHIAREARRIAATRPGGRLDPPLTLALDEAALICPVPLHQWTADMGGRGVTILAAFQSRSQMLDRYGEHPTATTLNNTGAIMLFGGTRDRDDLAFWSSLAGDRDEPVVTTDDHGKVTSRSVRKVPVLAPAQLANLPAMRVVVYRRGMPPVVGRVAMAWRRRDVRAQARQDERATRAVLDEAEAVTRVPHPDAPAGDLAVGEPLPPRGGVPDAPPLDDPGDTPTTSDPRGGGRRGRA